MGELFSLSAAVVWACAVILLRRSGETVPPFDLNLFRVGISSPLFVLVLVATGTPLLPAVAREDILVLALSGAVGIALSDTLFHRCLNQVGAGVTAIVDCLYSPLTALFALLMLGERLGAVQFAGMGLVIGGVILATRVRLPAGTTRRQLLVGILWGVLAMTTLALGIVLAKPVLGRAPLLWVVTTRQLSALLCLLPAALLSSRRRAILAVFRPGPTWRFTLGGTLLGSFLALIFWVAGMKYTLAGVAAVLNQTSTIYILVLASLFLREPFTRRKLAAAMLALGGIVLVVWG
jgi:drug/metabolite transporter (DMT)-like permease